MATATLKISELPETTSIDGSEYIPVVKDGVTRKVRPLYLKRYMLPGAVVLPWAEATAPTGWLLCDGSAISRTTYAWLFAKIGTTFGAGNGSTTFNIPDLRAATLRGVGTSTLFTQNITVTLAQVINDAMHGHHHSWLTTTGGGLVGLQGVSSVQVNTGVFGGTDQIGDPKTNGTDGTPRTANETRVKAIGFNFIIPFQEAS